VASPEGEWIALVDFDGRELGKMRKEEVHHDHTPLHRGFSAYLFDRSRRLLIQQRAHSKRTWPGVWSNSCCGHPAPGEPVLDAVVRRVRQELGVAPYGLWVALPEFHYRAVSPQGIVENELCPVVVGWIEAELLAPDSQEVAAVAWIDWATWCQRVESNPDALSPWARKQTLELNRLPAWRRWLPEESG
jgi:isopentenyl-diphosphate delta-isomerase